MVASHTRCFARFADRVANLGGKPLSFGTMAGIVSADFHGEATRIELSDPFDLVMSSSIDINNKPTLIHSINTGVPHAVVAVDNLDEIDVCKTGSAIRHHQHFSSTTLRYRVQHSSQTKSF